MSATAALARWAVGLRLAEVPDDVRRIARLALLDWYAVSWAARDEPAIRILREEAAGHGGKPVAGLIGVAERTSSASAAWVNGAAGHALDYDDVHNDIPGHATAPVAPAVLALAEQVGSPGAVLLTAFIAGYEATVYAARAASGLFARGYQASAAAGAIGAAVGCGRLLELDAERLRIAIGMAATQAAGLQATFGSMAKCYSVGRAAQSGLLAASIARRGFECAADVIEAPRGFAAVLGDRTTVTSQALGNDGAWHLRRNLFKLHASCFMTHAAMIAAARIRAEAGVAADRIASVTIEVEEKFHRVVLTPPPATGLAAKFNLAHCVALVLAGRDTGAPDVFDDATTRDPTVRALAARCAIRIVPGMPFTAAAVAVRDTNGDTWRAHCDVGEPEPDLDRLETQIRAKAGALLGGPADRNTTRLIDAFCAIGTIADVRALHPLLPAAALDGECRVASGRGTSRQIDQPSSVRDLPSAR